MPTEPHDRLLTPGEVAVRFAVTPGTVGCWARTGKLPSIRTPTGRLRFREVDVDAAMTTTT